MLTNRLHYWQFHLLVTSPEYEIWKQIMTY